MPLPLQLPEGSVVLSHRFGDGPFRLRTIRPRRAAAGIEIEGVYNAPRGE
jgi:hypothetical protein